MTLDDVWVLLARLFINNFTSNLVGYSSCRYSYFHAEYQYFKAIFIIFELNLRRVLQETGILAGLKFDLVNVLTSMASTEMWFEEPLRSENKLGYFQRLDVTSPCWEHFHFLYAL